MNYIFVAFFMYFPIYPYLHSIMLHALIILKIAAARRTIAVGTRLHTLRQRPVNRRNFLF